MMGAFARIAVRGDGGLILGKNFRGCLEAGAIYEIVPGPFDADEFIIRKVGRSVATVRDELFERGARGEDLNAAGCTYASWGKDASSLVENGDHLLTSEECIERTIRSFASDLERGRIDMADVPERWRAEVLRRFNERGAP